MDASEEIVEKYLLTLSSNVVFEPDGNIPPDFLLDSRIAIEVRRLNQNINNKGLEETRLPLRDRMGKLFQTFGPPVSNESWLVDYRFKRPIDNWKKLRSTVKSHLKAFYSFPKKENMKIKISENFEIDIRKITGDYPTFYVLPGYKDSDAGGWLLYEMEKNINICVEEKLRKTLPFRDKYPEWWLMLVDRIGYGLSTSDQEFLRDRLADIDHNFDKVILIDPLNHKRVFEL